MTIKRPTVTILPPGDSYPPCERPIVVMGDAAIAPHPQGGDVLMTVVDGVQVDWAPMERRGVLLPLFFGHQADTGVAVALSRDSFLALIAVLRSIETQL